MSTVKEIYQKLEFLLKKYPEISDMELCACGTSSTLNIFRQNPDGPITGLSLEDSSFTEAHICTAEEMVKLAGGGTLSEQDMEYLIQLSIEGSSEKQMLSFVKEHRLLESPGSLDIKISKSKETLNTTVKNPNIVSRDLSL